MISGVAMTAARLPSSTGAISSGHSVTITTASAPSAAESAELAICTPRGSVRAACSGVTIGSKATTSAPSAIRRAASTMLEASRMSSVSGLKASPHSAMRRLRSEPRWRASFETVRRFCSSFTSITALRSWKW